LALDGCAEIFKLQETDRGTHIWFGLWRKHGISEGASFSVCRPDGVEIGHGVVKKVDDNNAIAHISVQQDVLRGAFVRMNNEKGHQSTSLMPVNHK
jgi:hypothetical protein